MKTRRLSESELQQVARAHCDMPAARFAEYTEPEFIFDADDVHIVHWTYAQKLRFLLMTANYPHTH
jgi:hypothetical protein